MTAPIPRLPYTQIRPHLRSGDLLLCQGSSPMSQMIRAATGSAFSHVGILWRVAALDRILVLESVESIGVRAIRVSQYVDNYNHTGLPYPGTVSFARHRAFPTDVTTHIPFGQEAVDLLGTSYDTREIAAIALRIVGGKLGLPAQGLHQNRRLICSEFAALCLASMGIVVAHDPRGFIAPADFALCPDVSVLWELAPLQAA
jgi:hypothetical protein